MNIRIIINIIFSIGIFIVMIRKYIIIIEGILKGIGINFGIIFIDIEKREIF